MQPAEAAQLHHSHTCPCPACKTMCPVLLQMPWPDAGLALQCPTAVRCCLTHCRAGPACSQPKGPVVLPSGNLTPLGTPDPHTPSCSPQDREGSPACQPFTQPQPAAPMHPTQPHTLPHTSRVETAAVTIFIWLKSQQNIL